VRVLVLADTHVPHFAPALPAGLQRPLQRAGLILHAGDVTAASVLEELAQFAPVHVALGNNDRPDVAEWGAAPEVHVTMEAVTVAMVHDSGPRAGRERRLRRRFPEARVVVFGHSHIPIDADAGGQLLFNPGSPTWKRRQPRPTFGWLEIHDRVVRTRIVEL
jgi:putative phosphoesterase